MNALFLITGIFSPLEGINAYLDPGSGSFILQILLATLLGGFVIVRSYWTKIKDGVLRLFNKQQENGEDELDDPK